MSVKLVVCGSQAPVSWETFVQHEENYSIALDGYVHGGPRFDSKRVMASFNHHEEVDRLATRATCAQVLMAIRQGLFRTFRDEGGPRATVLVNDCDEDVCTSWFLLKNHAWSAQPLNPLLNRLVMMEDALDATAGAYPFPADLPALAELAWVFEPYRHFRLSGGLERQREGNAFRSVIDDVTHRIERHITGKGDAIALDTRYDVLHRGTGWSMVREVGAQARQGMFADGTCAYATYRERGDGSYTYVLGRMSTFIPFDLGKIFALCNEADAAGADRWGGSDMVGGSPRVGGSKITPDELTKIIESVQRL
jgi:hypothetical protein